MTASYILQDAVVLARKLRDVLRPNEASGDRPHTLRSLLTPDLVQVLRQYESERKARTRVITIRSNLMGRALQLPFAPVGVVYCSALPCLALQFTATCMVVLLTSHIVSVVLLSLKDLFLAPLFHILSLDLSPNVHHMNTTPSKVVHGLWLVTKTF